MIPRLSLRLPQGSDGLPVASAREARIARALVALATAWFFLVAAWEMFGPVLAGHWASTASMGIIAENMLRWGIPGPVWEYTASRPGPDLYYCHHPWGIFWVTAFFMKIVGRHDVVCRLAAILLSAATPPLLYAIGRSIWRPAAGAAAAVGFVVLPITLAFASFNALEVPLVFWSLLALYGWVRLVQTWRRRFLFVSALGLFMALHTDWPAFVLAGQWLGFGLVRGYLGGRRFFGPLHERRYAELWITWAVLSVLTGVLYLVIFQKAGKLGDLLAIYGSRSSGNVTPLSAVLASRRYWIELSFTPIAILLGKIAAVVCVLRLLVTRAEVELAPLLVLGMAAFQYVVFKQGADIHVFWPQPFGAYFALGMGALVATLAPLVERLVARVRRARQRPAEGAVEGGLVALGILLVPLVFVLRDGAPAALYARQTGGRFNEKGLVIDSDGDKTVFLRWLGGRIPPDATVELHEGMHATWAQVWSLGGRVVKTNQPVPAGPLPGRGSVYVMDSRFAPDAQLAAVAKRFHVTAVGPFWMVFPREPYAPIDAYVFEAREPGALAWMFVSATEPVRTIVPDVFATWEARVHWDQEATPPEAPPQTLEQKRIAHNVAVMQGDAARAEALFGEITRALRPIGATYEEGPEIVGSLFQTGVRPRLDLFVRASGPLAAGTVLSVRSRVTRRATLSTTMPDPTTRDVGLPLGVPVERMRKGFLYVDPVTIVKRPGVEVFHAAFVGRGKSMKLARTPGVNAIEVLRLD
ncbi:ArnT family glycosyltransferase [Polyangium sorediatum]|uniref:Glycosyltransferase family 39 protein n=1 Tax=Polyangium sorediatum TaxID=889274 RepID=A0ABT6P136_9BACT|nr:glycosyltransferase family 39 protein [Polyangium sorediatum]MDI1433970.1 glycosyltransferase family 39 protein [Polyangium sorediatum]